MPHSEEFNARRRAAYREGKLLGLSSRDAGHLYSMKDVERAASKVAKPDRRERGLPASERQESYAAKIGKGIAESKYQYRFHNSALVYTKVRVTLKTDEGRTHRIFTIVSDARPRRKELRAAVERFVETGNTKGSGTFANLLGFTASLQTVYDSKSY